MARYLFIFSVVAASVAVASVACKSGSSSSPTAAPAPSQVATAFSTVAVVGTPMATIPPTAISDAQKTALAAGGSTTFTAFSDPSGRYSVDLPDGWTIQKGQDGVSATLAGSPATAQLGVYCAKDATVDQLMHTDQSTQLQVQEGNMPLDNPKSITVAGTDAKEIIWQGEYQGIAHGHWFVYFEGNGCAWRLLLTTFPDANVDDMLAIFQHLLDSFKFS